QAADRAGGGADVLGHDGLTQQLAHALRLDAHAHIEPAAGRERHDQRDRPVGIVLRLRCGGEAQKDYERAGKLRLVHDGLLEVFGTADQPASSRSMRPFRRHAAVHSPCTPEALIGPAHFSISLGMYLARYSGLRRSGGMTVTPTAARRSRTDGVSIVSPAALLSLRTIASGARGGSTTALQVPQSNCASPCSCAVGRLGSTGTRSRPRMAIAFTVPASICGNAVEICSHM